jgi:hypothetical protein
VPAEIDRIAELWRQGRPLSEIGESLGVSRGVVAGAISRARRAGDTRFRPRPIGPRPIVAPKKLGVASSVAIVATEPLTRAARLLVDLGARDCLRPVSLSADQRHLF